MFNTIAVTVEPEKRLDNTPPRPETVGLIAALKQYFIMILPSDTPLALAVSVYCLATSSSICALTERMILQVPLVPITTIGMIILFMKSPKL